MVYREHNRHRSQMYYEQANRGMEFQPGGFNWTSAIILQGCGAVDITTVSRGFPAGVGMS